MAESNNAEENMFLVMYPYHLQEDELQYELDLRTADDPVPGETVFMAPARLDRRLQREKETNKDPLEWNVTLDETQRTDEIARCNTAITALREGAQALMMNLDRPADDVYTTASRVAHYYHRVERLFRLFRSQPTAEGEEPAQPPQELQTCGTNVREAKAYVEQMLKLIPPRPRTGGDELIANSLRSADNATRQEIAQTVRTVRDMDISATPVDIEAAAEVRRLEEIAAQHRNQELDIWGFRVEQVRNELVVEHMPDGAPLDVNRLKQLYGILLENHANFKRTVIKTHERELRDQITATLTQINHDVGWIRSRLSRTGGGQPSQNTHQNAPVANSTLQPPGLQPETSAQRYNQNVDQLQFNESFRNLDLNEDQFMSGIEGAAATSKAAFDQHRQEPPSYLYPEPPRRGPGDRVQNTNGRQTDLQNGTTPNAQGNHHQRTYAPNTPMPTNRANRVAFQDPLTVEPETSQNGSSNNSRQWPYHSENHAQRYNIYHPAIRRLGL